MKRSYPRLRVDVLCPTLISALSAAAIFPAILPGSRALSAMNVQEKGGRTTPTPTPTPPKPVSSKTSPKQPVPTTAAKRSRPKSSGPSGNQTSNALTELAFWQTIKDSTNSEDFSAYLQKYPNGKFAALAKNRLKALEGAKSSTNPSSTNPNPTNPGLPNGGSTSPASTTTGSPNSSSSKTTMPPNPPLPLHSFDFVTVTLDKDGKLKNRETKSAFAFAEDLGSGVKLEMVAIPPGEFMMGSPETEANRSMDEGPQHRVRIGYWLYMGKFEVTQAQWRTLMGTTPSNFEDCDECPVEQVSWDDTAEFCRKLSARMGREYRLPSEAEWEYAARAGTTTPFAFGDTITPEIVNYDGNSPYASAAKGTDREKTVPVGSLGVANAFGLYDMHGNVWEWCLDVYHNSYSAIAGDAPADGSAWTSGGTEKRVIRGSSFNHTAMMARAAYRAGYTSSVRYYNGGFRVVTVART